MLFRQVIHEDLGCASYLVGDAAAGIAAVVDPRFDVEVYLELARRHGVRIAHVLETHNHADHCSGHGRLAAATGATIHIHRLAGAGYRHEPFDDGWELALGTVRVRALHTPGHRPEHTAFVLVDTHRGDAPWAVLTGDTLLVGGVARPDLAIEKAAGAHGIFGSLHERLLPLGDHVEVWPGHLGGSMCGGADLDLKSASTIGFERQASPLLALDEDEFVARSLADLGPQPPNFEAIVALNAGPLVTVATAPAPLSPGEVAGRAAAGALIVDVRSAQEFDEAHVPGALCNPLGPGGFGTRLAWVAELGQELVFVGAGDEDARDAARLAQAVGLRAPANLLAGGMATWRAERRPVARIERLEVDELAGRLAAEPDLQLVDVRERAEWQPRHVPGSISLPWHELGELPPALDRERPIATLCGSGLRAAVAASLLLRAGAPRVLHVVGGGVKRWAALGHEVASAAGDAPGEASTPPARPGPMRRDAPGEASTPHAGPGPVRPDAPGAGDAPAPREP